MIDAIVVGGGFYGANIAAYLTTSRGLRRVVLVEREQDLMQRSSFVNQARIHNGYHYPRSFTTAYRSRINVPRFVAEYAPAVVSSFTQLYALARRNSHTTRRQMERFCREIGAPLAPAPPSLRGLFDKALIEEVYVVTEQAFDAEILRALMAQRLADAEVDVRLGAEVEQIRARQDGVTVTVQRGSDSPYELEAAMLFNCTYSRLGATVQGTAPPDFPLRHEIAELALIAPPPCLKEVGITVMDGAFFSTMPFPARNLHSLSHVRYTPHAFWLEAGDSDPYRRLDAYAKETRVDRMIRDAARYVPALQDSVPQGALFEIKTVLTSNDGDDGRPILFRRHGEAGRLFSILGGKLDNIYDILERLGGVELPRAGQGN